MTMSPRNTERVRFLQWLFDNYGKEVAEEFANNPNLGWPPKRNTNFGRIIGRGIKLDYEQLYNLFKTPAETPGSTTTINGKSFTHNPANPIWKQMGMQESAFASQYPDEYAQALEFNEQERRKLSETPELELERERFNWGKEQDAWQRQLSERQFAMEQASDASRLQGEKWAAQTASANAWLTNTLNYNTQENAMMERQKALEEGFEQGRQLSLRELNADPYKNWLTISDVKAKKNPYTVGDVDPVVANEIEVKKIDNSIKYYTDKLKELDQQLKDPTNPTYANSDYLDAKDQLSNILSSLKDRRFEVEGGVDFTGGYMKNALDTVNNLPGKNLLGMPDTNYNEIAKMAWEYGTSPQKYPAGIGGIPKEQLAVIYEAMNAGGSPAPVDRGTRTPDWLKTFTPGIGEYIPREGAVAQGITPSLQSWNRLAPTQRSMLSGYYERAGQNTDDMLWSMDIQTPKNLGLGRTWRPVRA